MEPMLRNLVLVFLLAGGVLHLSHRLRLPSIVGLLVAGVLIGPHGFGVLQDRDQIEKLAEIGILLMMFSIGLDFTRERLQELLYAAGIGTAQMAICIVVTALAASSTVFGPMPITHFEPSCCSRSGSDSSMSWCPQLSSRHINLPRERQPSAKRCENSISERELERHFWPFDEMQSLLLFLPLIFNSRGTTF